MSRASAPAFKVLHDLPSTFGKENMGQNSLEERPLLGTVQWQILTSPPLHQGCVLCPLAAAGGGGGWSSATDLDGSGVPLPRGSLLLSAAAISPGLLLSERLYPF